MNNTESQPVYIPSKGVFSQFKVPHDPSTQLMPEFDVHPETPLFDIRVQEYYSFLTSSDDWLTNNNLLTIATILAQREHTTRAKVLKNHSVKNIKSFVIDAYSHDERISILEDTLHLKLDALQTKWNDPEFTRDGYIDKNGELLAGRRVTKHLVCCIRKWHNNLYPEETKYNPISTRKTKVKPDIQKVNTCRVDFGKPRIVSPTLVMCALSSASDEHDTHSSEEHCDATITYTPCSSPEFHSETTYPQLIEIN